jgi:hypothetical protein
LTLLGNILREHQSKPSGEGGEGGVGGCWDGSENVGHNLPVY